MGVREAQFWLTGLVSAVFSIGSTLLQQPAALGMMQFYIACLAGAFIAAVCAAYLNSWAWLLGLFVTASFSAVASLWFANVAGPMQIGIVYFLFLIPAIWLCLFVQTAVAAHRASAMGPTHR